MSFWDEAFVDSRLSKQTSIFGLRLWVVIGICVGSSIVIFAFLLSLCLTSRRERSSSSPSPSRPSSTLLPVSSASFSRIHRKPLKLLFHDSTPPISKEILEIVKQNEYHEQHQLPVPLPMRTSSSAPPSGETPRGPGPEVSYLGWGHWYTLRELEHATDRFSDENVVGEGGYGIVYRGVLPDKTVVAVKNLLNNRGQAEKEFKVEVEAIGRVRHKNLVRLLGYSAEGAHRMLVYEYMDNGNLNQWLHGDIGQASPLTWDMRMNIILSTAKGLAYLHEGLEPKVVHRDVKSSNILLDRQWNAKVSDFGLAKLLCSERTYVTTRVMGTFGYVAPEYASTGMLNETSDVYSLGVLIMEIISGRTPVDYSRPRGEVNLVDWLKTMVGERRSEQVIDPKMPEEPSPKALKRALLMALRCVDPDAQQRPKMGHVVHMLEEDDFIIREDRKVGRELVAKPLVRYCIGEEEGLGRHKYQEKGWR